VFGADSQGYDTASTKVAALANIGLVGEFLALPRANDEVEKSLNRNSSADGALDRPQNLKLNDSSNATSVENEISSFRGTGRVTYPSNDRTRTPAKSGLKRITQGPNALDSSGWSGQESKLTDECSSLLP
jgi:hypothetical protein